MFSFDAIEDVVFILVVSELFWLVVSVVSIWWCCFTLCSWIVVNDLSELFPPVVLNCCCCRCIWYWIIWPHSPLTGCVVWCMLLMSLLFLFVLCVVGFQCCAWCRPAHLGPLSTNVVLYEYDDVVLIVVVLLI